MYILFKIDLYLYLYIKVADVVFEAWCPRLKLASFYFCFNSHKVRFENSVNILNN